MLTLSSGNLTSHDNLSQGLCEDIPSRSDETLVIGYFLIVIPVLSLPLNAVMLMSVISAPRLTTHIRCLLSSFVVCEIIYSFPVVLFRNFDMVTVNLHLLSDSVCDIINSADLMMSAVTIYHMVVLAFERFIAMVHPFQQGTWFSLTSTIVLLLVCWIFPAGLAFGAISRGLHVVGIEKVYRCTVKRTGSCPSLYNLPYATFITCACFILPSIGILVCNNQTLRKITLKQRILAKVLVAQTSIGLYESKHFGSKLGKTLVTMAYWTVILWLPHYTTTFVDSIILYKTPYFIKVGAAFVGYSSAIMTPCIYLKHTGFKFRRTKISETRNRNRKLPYTISCQRY